MREPGQEVCWGGTLQVGLRFSSEPRPFLPGLECSTSSVVFGNGLRPCAFSIILNFNEILPFYFEWVNHMFAEILHALILSAHRQRPSPTSPTVSSLRTSQDTSHLWAQEKLPVWPGLDWSRDWLSQFYCPFVWSSCLELFHSQDFAKHLLSTKIPFTLQDERDSIGGLFLIMFLKDVKFRNI